MVNQWCKTSEERLRVIQSVKRELDYEEGIADEGSSSKPAALKKEEKHEKKTEEEQLAELNEKRAQYPLLPLITQLPSFPVGEDPDPEGYYSRIPVTPEARAQQKVLCLDRYNRYVSRAAEERQKQFLYEMRVREDFEFNSYAERCSERRRSDSSYDPAEESENGDWYHLEGYEFEIGDGEGWGSVAEDGNPETEGSYGAGWETEEEGLSFPVTPVEKRDLKMHVQPSQFVMTNQWLESGNGSITEIDATGTLMTNKGDEEAADAAYVKNMYAELARESEEKS